MLPKSVTLREDGPREGFQMLPDFVPTEEKLKLINLLAETGVRHIEVTSFVRHDRVPQLRDAGEVASALVNKPDLYFTALYLNEIGFKRVLEYPSLSLEGFVLLSASETFLKSNNNQTISEALSKLSNWSELFRHHGVQFDRLMISQAFGDNHEGRRSITSVLDLCKSALKQITETGMTPLEVTFADTTGWGNPETVRALVAEFRSANPTIAVGLHLHDTRGTGMANVFAGLKEGVSRFDCSVGGLGGCPFTPGAAGNVPTEDVAFMCEELGIDTGINLEQYVECARFAERLAKRPLPGKLKVGGMPAAWKRGSR